MSVKVMAWVWDQEMPTKEKFVLLAYADHADHEGGSIFPANKTIADKTGYSVRAIQRITRRLEEHGLLIADGENVGGRNRPNRWRIPIYGGLKGDLNVMLSKKLPDLKGDKTRERVTKPALKDDIAVSPESSSNHQLEPSEEEEGKLRKLIVAEWEGSVGTISSKIADDLWSLADESGAHVRTLPDGAQGADLSGNEWVLHAIKTARRSASGKFNVRYVQAILDRWIRDGFDSPFTRTEAEAYTTGVGKDFWK